MRKSAPGHPNRQNSLWFTSHRQVLGHWCVVILCWGIGGAIALPVSGEIVFGSLGVTLEDPAWPLAGALGSVMALIALRLPAEQCRSARQCLSRQCLSGQRLCKPHVTAQLWIGRWPQVMVWISRILSGGLLGFFYGGRWAEDDWRGAIAGLIAGLLLATFMNRWGKGRYRGLERLFGGAIAFWMAYSLWLWFAAWGLSALWAGRWLIGGFYGAVAVIFGRWVWLSHGWLKQA